jgi:tRNA 2-thiouridine synthesizing protein E
MSLVFNHQEIPTDKQGYLINFKDWHNDLAQLIADKDELVLTEAHWEVIRFVREFYIAYNTSPAIRALTKAMKAEFGEEKASSRYLYRLFKEGPAKQATKYAGLPKPARCI